MTIFNNFQYFQYSFVGNIFEGFPDKYFLHNFVRIQAKTPDPIRSRCREHLSNQLLPSILQSYFTSRTHITSHSHIIPALSVNININSLFGQKNGTPCEGNLLIKDQQQQLLTNPCEEYGCSHISLLTPG